MPASTPGPGLPESELSLTQGGPLFRLEACLHLLEPKRVGPRLLAAVFGLTWLPLILLALPQLTAEGTWDPLLVRSEVHVRLLVSLVLFLSGEIVLEQRGRTLTRYLRSEGFVPDDKLVYWHRALLRLQQLRDAWAPEILLVMAVYGISLLAYQSHLPTWMMRWLAPTLHQASTQWENTSPTAWWYMLISQPFFLFVLLRWILRWVLFSKLLFRLATLSPRIQSSHSDRVGGLSFLRTPLYALRFVAAGSAFAFMSVWIDEIQQNQADPSVFAHDFLVFLVASMVLALLPYLGFMKPLLRQKQRALFAYSALVNRYAQRFDARWLNPSKRDDDALLGHLDFSSFSDLGTTYGTVASMRTIIPDGSDLKAHLIASTAPFSVIFFVYGEPTADVLKRAIMKFIGV